MDPDNTADEIERLLQEVAPRLVRRLGASLGREAAEDVVQDSLLKAWTLLASGVALDVPAAWLTRTAVNAGHDVQRRRRAEGQAYERWSQWVRTGGPVQVAPSAEGLDHQIVVALEGLPARQREAVILHYFGDLSVEAVARSLGVSPGTTKSDLHRARSRVRDALRRQARPKEREMGEVRNHVKGWSLQVPSPSDYEFSVVEGVTYGELPVASVRCTSASREGVAIVQQACSPMDFIGKRMRMRATMNATEVDGWAGMFMQVVALGGHSLAFDNMQDRPLTGTTDWAIHDVVLDVEHTADCIVLGFILQGGGELRIADVRFEEASGEELTSRRRSILRRPINLGFTDSAPLTRDEIV